VAETIVIARELDQLLELIHNAFHDVRLGAGISISQARVIDDRGSTKEEEEARSSDKEESWTEIPDEKVEWFNDTLSFMDAKGLRFYLPAFMSYALRNPHSTSFAVDAPIYALWHERGGIEYREKMFSVLNQRQKEAIYAFLLYCSVHEECNYDTNAAREAIAKYWYRYTPSEAT